MKYAQGYTVLFGHGLAINAIQLASTIKFNVSWPHRCYPVCIEYFFDCLKTRTRYMIKNNSLTDDDR